MVEEGRELLGEASRMGDVGREPDEEPLRM